MTFVQGSVTVNPPQSTGTVPAQLNMPLLSGVRVATGADGQAEVEFEDGSVARLTPNSALSLDALAVDPNGVFTTGLTLLQGLAYFELRATPQYRYSVAAGGDVLSPVENATVRVNFDEPPAIFAVLDGTAQVSRQSGPLGEAASAGYETEVRAGESLRADASSGNRYFLTQQIDGDSWDQWNQDMDQSAAAEASDTTSVRNDYAGAQGYGWSDLDANGSWYDVPGSGPVWQPNVAADGADFDPYGNGAWVGYPGAGYLWASSYPWGWTPYRCGNWSYFGGFGWGWAPGTSCGGFGWGFYGGGALVNIAVFPSGYHQVRVPVAHPGGGGGWRPIVPVHGPGGVNRGPGTVPVRSGMRRIGGISAARIEPVGRDARTQHDGVAGASLRRDYPVDSRTKAPVLGLASTRPAMVRGSAGEYTTGQQRPGSVQVQTVQPEKNPSYGVQSTPANGGQGRQGRGARSDQPVAGQGQRQDQGQRSGQAQQNGPAQRAPDQPLAPTIYPSTQPEHRIYSAPVPSTPGAPAQPQPEHRVYTPPPNGTSSVPAPPQTEHRSNTPPASGAAPQPEHRTPPPSGAAAQPEHRTYTPPPPSAGAPAPQPEHRSFTPPPPPAAAPPPPAPSRAPSSPPPSHSSPAPSAPSPARTAPK
ncbi:MAG TPA: DUF6600 domain-containing protein [Acidobacteriaceae bacterium]